ncbi:membrane associated progesterone receptor, putative, partial [Perkinsus marinus ATCC 50983]
YHEILRSPTHARYDTYQDYRARRKQEEWERRVARMTIPTKAGWTAAELSAYDGPNDTPILIGVKGKVYNVWTRPDFYGPGGGYHVFAGRDASRLLAKVYWMSGRQRRGV